MVWVPIVGYLRVSSKLIAMTTLCYYRELAIDQVSHQYSVEKQCLMCLEVLRHKAYHPPLRQALTFSMTDARLRVNTLRGLLSSMNTSTQAFSTAGANGILKEGFQRLERATNVALRDAIILQTIILLHQYRLGNYRIIHHYFRALDWGYEANLLQGLLTDAEATLHQFTDLLTTITSEPVTSARSDVSSASPSPVAEPAVAQQFYL
jgi:ferritin-like metal-binding protein YciE